ncbi:MAG: hypothetical protein H6672_00550 [Anaerolineaceae bacterium]|nr:hypothetical protein [Anaerolineaceae bacterium]
MNNYPLEKTLRSRFRPDWGLLITLALCLFALWPLAYRPGLPNGTDVLYHVYRVAEMDRAWSHGVLIPQWAETFYTGYGAPLFHYYASLTYYVTSILSRLFALDAVNSLRLLIVLGALGAGAGMYTFARVRGGKIGGVLAALVYVYSPYLLFTEPYARGAYPEFLALVLLPWVMVAYDRLRRHGGAGAFFLAALSSGALIITHNLMALVLTGLLGAWLVWGWLADFALSPNPRHTSARLGRQHFSIWKVLFPVGAHRRAPLPPIGLNEEQTKGASQSRASKTFRLLPLVALVMGVGLAAYFWLPVMLESSAVRLGNLTAVAQLDYKNFFVPFRELLAQSPRTDAGAINGLLHQLNLGVAQWILALTGIVTVVLARRQPHPYSLRSFSPLQMERGGRTAGSEGVRLQADALFFTLAAAGMLFLILPVSAFLWEATAPLAFLQFPWRLLGPVAFCLTVLAGMNGLWLARLPGRVRAGLLTVVVFAVVGLATPLFYVDEWEHETVDTSVAAYHAQELAGKQRATTFSNEYLPATVLVEPGATPRLLADYADGYPVNKAHLEVLPEGVRVELLAHGPQADSWRITTPETFTFEVLTYAFPGWTAAIDGATVPITPSDPHGLITFPIPAGEHTVTLTFELTPPSLLGVLVSLLTLVFLVVAGWYIRRRGWSAPALPLPALDGASRAGLVVGGVLALAFVLVYVRPGGAWVDSPPGEAQLAEYPVHYDLADGIRFLGYDLSGRIFRPGDQVELTVYWYAAQTPVYGYASFVHISAGGPPLAQADLLNPAGRPTKEWTPDGFIRDPYTIDLPPDMPPGEYQLLIGLYTCDTRPPGECGNGDRLPVTDAAGNPIGDVVPLGTIRVE